jgi:hypothetical protein
MNVGSLNYTRGAQNDIHDALQLLQALQAYPMCTWKPRFDTDAAGFQTLLMLLAS